MPQPPTTYMLLVLPTEGDDDDLWDGLLNTALGGPLDGHDHTTNKGKQIPSAGINIDAALDFHNQQATNVGGVAFVNLGAALTSGSDVVFVDGHNLKFRNGAGVNVRITNGNALDVTTVGAIAGDYTTVGAELAYVDASDAYTHKQQVGGGVRQYGKIASADLQLFEYKAHPAAGVPTNYVGLRSPAALPGTYTLTFPSALPGSTLIQQVSAAGVMSWSNTIANAVTLSALLTANAGITLAVDTDVNMSGVGRLKRANWGLNAAIASGVASGGTVTYDATLTNLYVASTGAGTWTFEVPLRDHVKITEINAEIYGNGVCNIVMDAARVDGAGVTGVASNNATPGAAYVLLTIVNATLQAAWTALGQTFLVGAKLVIKLTFSAANGRVRRVYLTGEEV